ncbi:hypothetical protein E8E11_005607 [Didymella keratinophila]|nr:hypothetical protein E8E11_005607 [Didymella keratinophila]
MQLLLNVACLMALCFSAICHAFAAISTVSAHNYTFKELEPHCGSQGSFRQPYFRFNVFFRKNANITEEQFHRHWKTVHADLTISEPDAGLRLLRYTQFHQDAHHRQFIRPLIAVSNGLMEIAPYDGVAEFLTKDYATFGAFILQIFGNPILVADQQSFVDSSLPMHVMAGYDDLIFGDAIDAAEGRDGILPDDPRLVYS